MENPSNNNFSHPKTGYYVDDEKSKSKVTNTKKSVYGEGSEVQLNLKAEETHFLEEESQERFDWNERYQKIFKNLMSLGTKTLK